MKLIYTDHPLPADVFDSDTLFMLGPVPRRADVPSWRPEALDILSRLKYKGTVLIPEWTHPSKATTFQVQCDWERQCLEKSRRLAFWVPRSMATLPALTTNVEFGMWLGKRPNACRYGRPFWAEHCDYLDWLYIKETGRKPSDTLFDMLQEAIQ